MVEYLRPNMILDRGKPTGLAGCDMPCHRAGTCARADPRHAYRAAPLLMRYGDRCISHIATKPR